MPGKVEFGNLLKALNDAGYSVEDANRITTRSFRLPDTHRARIQAQIISHCLAGTLGPETLDGQKLINLSKGLLK